jgi:cytochrome c
MFKTQRLFLLAAAVLAPALSNADPMPDVENGKKHFNTMCNVCHSVQETGTSGEGPNLWGLVGRQAGSRADFAKYSPALKASGLTWSTQNLDQFLVSPMAMVPGTFMPMQIRDDKTRADVIAYLATLRPLEESSK